MDFHLNITQDVGHGVTVIFICCIIIIASVLLDLNTGVAAAKKCHEKIRSRILRRTVTKILDYLRVLLFGVMIDVLGLNFTWYDVPYCAILVTVGVVAIEAKSVFENYSKSKSAARELPEVIGDIISADNVEKAKKVIDKLK